MREEDATIENLREKRHVCESYGKKTRLRRDEKWLANLRVEDMTTANLGVETQPHRSKGNWTIRRTKGNHLKGTESMDQVLFFTREMIRGGWAGPRSGGYKI